MSSETTRRPPKTQEAAKRSRRFEAKLRYRSYEQFGQANSLAREARDELKAQKADRIRKILVPAMPLAELRAQPELGLPRPPNSGKINTFDDARESVARLQAAKQGLCKRLQSVRGRMQAMLAALRRRSAARGRYAEQGG